MSTHSGEIEGVAAFIVTPEDTFLTLRELRSKQSTNKLAGMRSIPMETVEAGESHPEAIRRLFKEELLVRTDHPLVPTGSPICRVQLSPNIWLNTYLFLVPTEMPAVIGSANTEVDDPQWRSLYDPDLLRPLKYRPGVLESTVAYRAANHLLGKTSIYPTTKESVPLEVFRLLAAGLSQTEALSQAGVHLVSV